MRLEYSGGGRAGQQTIRVFCGEGLGEQWNRGLHSLIIHPSRDLILIKGVNFLMNSLILS